MPRRNGSYFGLTVNPTPSVASGIWRVREAEEFLRVNKWPATPGVPGSPVGAAGDAQVSLTWSAPSLGSPPTDYQIQYSSNSGTTWTTFADGTSAATSAVVTGLTNDTGYIFRVRAVNALGDGPYGAASGTVTPFAINAALLLHFDGTNGSTAFTDSSPNAFTVTANGNAQIGTAQSKFGGASGLFNDTDAYLSIAHQPELSLSQNGTAESFTIEFWIRPNATQTPSASIGYSGAVLSRRIGPVYATYELLMRDNLGVAFLAKGAGDFWNIGANSSTILTADAWAHIAVVCDNGSLTLFVNGVADANINATPAVFFDAEEPVYIGRGGDGFFNGYIDELRIVTGTAIYTANFTPPTAPF